jgi:hypothetical protein
VVLYLDICCLKRPFDDQAQPRIRIESEAVLSDRPRGAVMTSAISNPVELRSRSFQALVKELGWVNAVRFLREYETGEGDYAERVGPQRDSWLAHRSRAAPSAATMPRSCGVRAPHEVVRVDAQAAGTPAARVKTRK